LPVSAASTWPRLFTDTCPALETETFVAYYLQARLRAVRHDSCLVGLDHRRIGARVPRRTSSTIDAMKPKDKLPAHDPASERRPRLAGDNERKRKGEDGTGTAVITKTKTQTKRPSLYRVLLLNDDYTPMEFVVHVLERFFNKDREAATRIMLHVHHHGIGECGVFTYEVAETKVTQVMDFARKHQHPLQCVMEKK
jgi:ATP-dependent Clp protease adaptor protein ClpS